MNAIGPIEAEMRARRLAIRQKFENPAALREKIEREKQEKLEREQYRKLMDVVSKFIRYDVRYNDQQMAPNAPKEVTAHYALTRAGKVHQIIEQVAKDHGVTVANIKGIGRYRRYVLARQECFYRIHTEIENMSLPMIGRAMGGRDHTTVLHGIRRHKKRIEAGEV